MYKIYVVLIAVIISSFQISYAAPVLESELNNTFTAPQTIVSASFTTVTNLDLQDDSLPTASIQGNIGIEGEIANDIDFYSFNFRWVVPSAWILDRHML